MILNVDKYKNKQHEHCFFYQIAVIIKKNCYSLKLLVGISSRSLRRHSNRRPVMDGAFHFAPCGRRVWRYCHLRSEAYAWELEWCWRPLQFFHKSDERRKWAGVI